MDNQLTFDTARIRLSFSGKAIVTTKDAYWRPFWRLIDILLRIVSIGRIDNFMRCTTTVGRVIAFPENTNLDDVSLQEVVTLEHETVHLNQFARYGVLLTSLLYLLFPLPIGLAYFRYKFERDAYLAGHLYARSLGWERDIESYVTLLSGPAYLWAWPASWVRKWFTAKCSC